jgi:hypothetical protein
MGPAADVLNRSRTISLALNLLPFAGIAFVWFIGLLLLRLGEREDRFFATVFLAVECCTFPWWVLLISLYILIDNLHVTA